ncbi:Met-10+ like-protein-domain-containing protein [Xylariaceae sp. FL0804]|nr:Met-10+ like-protein-domain-containing protein [Xylariaceae sp. FL0804]
MSTTPRFTAAAIAAALRPPTIRSAATSAAAGGLVTLDRSQFRKTVGLAAAAVADRRRIAHWRAALQRDGGGLLAADRVSTVAPHPDPALASGGAKCLLLHPEVRPGQPETWSAALREGVSRSELGVVPYDLQLDYDYYAYDEVIRAVLPNDARDRLDGVQAGFNQAGHVAHLNLRAAFLPYGRLIGEVLVDKNARVRTVINKVDDVGAENEFRTFAYEVLAGPDDLDVEVHENHCAFHFDYAKVYWNSKLETEHTRLVNLFRPGEVVCDLMAGVGPFAVPAGKKGVIVWANDYNPESWKYLDENIRRNKVDRYVRSFNEDGRTFIRKAADLNYEASIRGETIEAKTTRKELRQQHFKARKPPGPLRQPKGEHIPPTISHFVMNLPASAITFLPYFRGLYAGREQLFAPHTRTQLPMIHVHCFAAKILDEALPDVCGRVAAELGVAMKLGDADVAGEVSVLHVRDVAPHKSMFCASFRLPAEVAFASRN